MSSKSIKPSLKRHVISLEQKIQILNRLNKGEKTLEVAKSLGFNEATIRTILRNEKKIRASASIGSSVSANMTARSRKPIIEKMEKALNIWMQDCIKRRIPVDPYLIKQRAVVIYNFLKEYEETPQEVNFVASRGWFDRFRRRFPLPNNKMHNKTKEYVHEETKSYPKELQKILNREDLHIKIISKNGLQTKVS